MRRRLTSRGRTPHLASSVALRLFGACHSMSIPQCLQKAVGAIGYRLKVTWMVPLSAISEWIA